MMRTVKQFPFSLTTEAKNGLLHWAQQFQEVVWLDSNNYPHTHTTYQAILAIDAFSSLKTEFHNAFDKLKEYQKSTDDWLFGYLTYDLKNDVENLHSHNGDGLKFPDLYFFQPKKLFLFSENNVELHYLNALAGEMEVDLQTISEKLQHTKTTSPKKNITIHARTSKADYLEKVERALQHIQRGDIYEVNLCQEFYSEETQIDPLQVFLQLNGISKAPFSAFIKLNDIFALSASPERYLKRTGTTVVSQPIKGTARRFQNRDEDLKMAQQLAMDPKERSENIMITDLVRNDLSRIAEKGSVSVEELCAVYTFEQVHQMISTITCRVAPTTFSVEIVRNTFPMGSMTGAPKIAAMQIIEDLEDAKRGLYSGAIGYFSPSGDFDLNVVIRSILFNSSKNYVSFSVGGAITINSVPEKEYEECLLKAKAMREVLHHSFKPRN